MKFQRLEDMTEPFQVEETVINGIGDIEEIAPHFYRVTLYARRKGYGGVPENVAAVKLLLSGEALASIAAIGKPQQPAVPFARFAPGAVN